MQQKIKKPAGGPGFEVVRGGEPNPEESLEAFSQNYQKNYGPVNLLADLLDRHLLLRSEFALLCAENARLRLIVGEGV